MPGYCTQKTYTMEVLEGLLTSPTIYFQLLTSNFTTFNVLLLISNFTTFKFFLLSFNFMTAYSCHRTLKLKSSDFLFLTSNPPTSQLLTYDFWPRTSNLLLLTSNFTTSYFQLQDFEEVRSREDGTQKYYIRWNSEVKNWKSRSLKSLQGFPYYPDLNKPINVQGMIIK